MCTSSAAESSAERRPAFEGMRFRDLAARNVQENSARTGMKPGDLIGGMKHRRQ